MKKVLVISDTHGSLPDWICDIPADAVFHAGDIGDEPTLTRLHCFDTVHAVHGNTDTTLRELPETIRVDIDGVRFFLVHNLTAPHRIMASNAAELAAYRPRVVVFGHTHEPLVNEKGGVLYLNPGSLGRAGINGRQTYALVSLESGAVKKIEIFDMTRRSIITWPV
jgi:putative phosphoesterase